MKGCSGGWANATGTVLLRVTGRLYMHFSLFLFFLREFRTGALCTSTASCPFPRPQGASLATFLLRQTGGGASDVEIPCQEL